MSLQMHLNPLREEKKEARMSVSRFKKWNEYVGARHGLERG
jgi:hypothetical protein